MPIGLVVGLARNGCWNLSTADNWSFFFFFTEPRWVTLCLVEGGRGSGPGSRIYFLKGIDPGRAQLKSRGEGEQDTAGSGPTGPGE